jgi:hypothetical protein
VERHDFEIEDYVDQQVSSSVDYAFSFQPKPIEPFKNTGFMKKNSYGNCSVILILIIYLLMCHLILTLTDNTIVSNLDK